MNKILIIVLLVIIVGGGFILFNREAVAPTPDTEDPTGDEREVAYTNASSDMIIVDSPEPGERITSPLTIRGEARGQWYFEASFPFSIVDWDGRIIAESFATAQDDWMTEEFVAFEGALEFQTPDTSVSDRGWLIIRNDNASGLPENDRAIEIPILFQ